MHMQIVHISIDRFRALESVSVPLRPFSVLMGENDVGKTSLIHALDCFFAGKKLTAHHDWFKKDTEHPVRIEVTLQGIDDTRCDELRRADGSLRVCRVFEFNKTPTCSAVLDDGSEVAVPKAVVADCFGADRFHLIPVRRDLDVQFAMTKSALLGKTLRKRMAAVLAEGTASTSMTEIVDVLTAALDKPKSTLESHVRQQMHDDAIRLGFDDLAIDPIEGVSFSVTLSDDRVEDVPIANRGAGTQNNLIIALFRLVADLAVEGDLILAMEEPENSLHPKAQRQLLAVLQDISAATQVLVTTHSPVFIDRSRFENNIILTRTVSGNTVAKTLDMDMLDDVRADLGIRASDALLKGGGNCALLVEGKTEEDGFPVFFEMCNLSEFHLGTSIVNMDGSNLDKPRRIATLLKAYDIPCIVVLDNNASATAVDLARMQKTSLDNIREIFVLSKGNIEDYFPLEVVADVINQTLSPDRPIVAADFDDTKHGKERLDDFSRVMHDRNCGKSVRFLKQQLGGLGARLLKDRGDPLDPELATIIEAVRRVAEEA